MISILLSSDDRELIARLTQQNARVITWPMPKIHGRQDHSALDEAIENLFGYDWLIFKNEHAAEFFQTRMQQLNHDADELDNLKVLAIGDRTEQKLIDISTHVDIALPRFSLANVFPSVNSYIGDRHSLARLNFLVPSAGINGELFEDELREAEARVDNVAAYVTTVHARQLRDLNALLIGGSIDFVIFTKPSTLPAFAEVYDTDDIARILRDVLVICTDKQSHEMAAQFGLSDIAMPDESTLEGILRLTMSSQNNAQNSQ